MRSLAGPLVGLLIGAGVVWGVTSSQTPSGPALDEVAVFNDGWATSKQDDCDMGSQYACNWLDGE